MQEFFYKKTMYPPMSHDQLDDESSHHHSAHTSHNSVTEPTHRTTNSQGYPNDPIHHYTTSHTTRQYMQNSGAPLPSCPLLLESHSVKWMRKAMRKCESWRDQPGLGGRTIAKIFFTYFPSSNKY